MKQLPDKKALDIMWTVATSGSLETGTRPHYGFADLLYDYLTDNLKNTYGVELNHDLRAKVQFKFDATYTYNYNSSYDADDFIPEEHYLITAPAADLNAKQYFKLFEKFLLCVGMCPSSIRSGAMSLVFNDWTGEEEQRKVCKEYEITMDEDLDEKFKEWKIRDEEIARLLNSKKGPMGTVLQQEEDLIGLE